MKIKANLREELKDLLMEIEEHFPEMDAQELLVEALEQVVLRHDILDAVQRSIESSIPEAA